MSSTPSADALRIAQEALDEVSPKGSVGDVTDVLDEAPGVISVRYASLLGGYPDWHWTVTMTTDVEGGPSVLEVALLPTDTSLLSPQWVPWADRLADYLAAKDAGAEGEVEFDDEDLDDDADADADDDEFDDDDADDAADDAPDDDDADDEDDERRD